MLRRCVRLLRGIGLLICIGLLRHCIDLLGLFGCVGALRGLVRLLRGQFLSLGRIELRLGCLGCLLSGPLRFVRRLLLLVRGPLCVVRLLGFRMLCIDCAPDRSLGLGRGIYAALLRLSPQELPIGLDLVVVSLRMSHACTHGKPPNLAGASLPPMTYKRRHDIKR